MPSASCLTLILFHIVGPSSFAIHLIYIVMCWSFMQITPAHDPNDFEVGRRHDLQFINIFTDDGKINNNGGAQFEGMLRFNARVCVIEALK